MSEEMRKKFCEKLVDEEDEEAVEKCMAIAEKLEREEVPSKEVLDELMYVSGKCIGEIGQAAKSVYDEEKMKAETKKLEEELEESTEKLERELEEKTEKLKEEIGLEGETTESEIAREDKRTVRSVFDEEEA